ncbi:MAG TPA: alanine racemase [Polyangia bacterium]|nr:alanine racemase [Polyangia bacterium]
MKGREPPPPLAAILAKVTRPECLVDLDRARANATRMAEKARRSGVAFRPHFKTHQSAAVGEIFCDLDITGITVSSLEMASYFADAGFRDITVAFPLNPRRLPELDALAGRVALGVLVDNPAAADALDGFGRPVRVWIEIDSGQGRSGIPWNEPAAMVALARHVRRVTGRPLAGLLTHAGHSYTAGSPARVREIHAETISRMTRLAGELERADGSRPLVSVGDTPCCALAAELSGVDEVRPGNFVFFDATQLAIGSCAPSDLALAVACPVVGVYPARREIVLHGGAIHLSKDSLVADGERVFGLLAAPDAGGLGLPDPRSKVIALSQEHAVARVPDPDRWRVGDVALVFPAHACLTAEMFSEYRATTGERLPRFVRQTAGSPLRG